MSSFERETTKRKEQGWRSVGQLVQPMVSACFNTQDFLNSQLLRDWPAVVGPEINQWSTPLKISVQHRQGILHIAIHPSQALMVHQYVAVILERVNRYLGYQGVQKTIFRHQTVTSSSFSKEKSGFAMTRKTPSIPHVPSRPAEDLCWEQQYPALKDVPFDTLREGLIQLGFLMGCVTEKKVP